MTGCSILERKLSDAKPELPLGWEYPRLGEIVTIKYGKGLPTKNLIESGYPVFGANGVIGFHKEYLYEDEQVLISCRGAYSGKINWSPAKCFVTNNSLVLEVPQWQASIRKYLFYALQAIDRSKLVTGSAQPQVTINNAEVLRVPIAPKDQQQLIVAEIEKQFSRLDEAVANLKRVKANLKRYKAAVLKAAVEGKLTEDWRKQHPNVEPASKLLERILAERRAMWKGKGKYKEPTASDTDDLPSQPKGWTWATVEQLAAGCPGAIQSGPFGSQLLHSEFVDDGILAIGIDNILDGKFSLGRQHRITPEKFETLRKFEARPRDVVITVMATVGRVCVLPQSLERAIITKHCYRITPVPGNVDSEFLAVALRADSSTRQYIFGNVRGQTRPGINGPILKAAPVSLPPFIEQTEIVAEVERSLSVIEELEAAVEANLTRADHLRQAILRHAFSGNLIATKGCPRSTVEELGLRA